MKCSQTAQPGQSVVIMRISAVQHRFERSGVSQQGYSLFARVSVDEGGGGTETPARHPLALGPLKSPGFCQSNILRFQHMLSQIVYDSPDDGPEA